MVRMDERKLTRRAALACLGSGAAVALSGSFGFNSATAGRGVSVAVADDPRALLGLGGVKDGSTTPTFENNSSHPMDITLDSSDGIELDVGNTGTWSSPPVSFSLSVGETEQVNIRFAGDCTSSGTATVNVDAQLDGGTAGTISLVREYEVPQAGQVEFAGTANSAGSSGIYEFQLENTGCGDVTFTGIKIVETTTDADYVSGGGSLTNSDTGAELITQRIDIGSCDPQAETCYDMDPTVSLPQNQTVNFKFNKFRRNGRGKKNVDMRGEDVRITLYYGDGSSSTVELCLGSCDF